MYTNDIFYCWKNRLIPTTINIVGNNTTIWQQLWKVAGKYIFLYQQQFLSLQILTKVKIYPNNLICCWDKYVYANELRSCCKNVHICASDSWSRWKKTSILQHLLLQMFVKFDIYPMTLLVVRDSLMYIFFRK